MQHALLVQFVRLAETNYHRVMVSNRLALASIAAITSIGASLGGCGSDTQEATSDATVTTTGVGGTTSGSGGTSSVGTGGGGGSAPDTRIWGRFESGGPITSCGQVRNDWNSSDGTLLRMSMDVCGDDMSALAQTISDNLDAIATRNGRALLILAQGTNLPASWLSQCQTFPLNSGNFSGDICVPWDASYQAALTQALQNQIGPAVDGHPALAGVYFTTTTMTNGAEMHFRVAKDDFTPHPGQQAFTGAYTAVMDIYQQAFNVPVVFEAGHCIFDVPGAAAADIDCETPLALYRHSRDTYGASATGIALWNCAERFWHGPGSVEDHTRPLLEEATADRVSIGCQTVGNFTNQPCRFSDPAIGDYGTSMGMGSNITCTPAGANDSEAACVDTLAWFAGISKKSSTSVDIVGTWVESWNPDTDPVDGIIANSAACRSAVDMFAQPND